MTESLSITPDDDLPELCHSCSQPMRDDDGTSWPYCDNNECSESEYPW